MGLVAPDGPDKMSLPTATLLVVSLLTPVAAKRTVWILESETYAAQVSDALKSDYDVVQCGSPRACPTPDPSVEAVVGRADELPLEKLTGLKLVQGSSYFYTDPSAVPARASIATTTGFWPAMGNDQIAEWCIAAVFENQYRLEAAARTYRSCAFAADAPQECPADSTATNHTMVSDLVIGVLGYGRIGSRVARKAAGVGATVVATKRHGPFEPPPPGVKWLSSDNDRLYREADVIVVTVPGSGHPETAGLINRTALALMKPHALIVPVSAGPLNFEDLEAALKATPRMRAVIDTWPSGCWHYPNASCGPPYGEHCWPGSKSLAELPNVLPLPGVSMRDAAFWKHSTSFAAANLDALAEGRPLQGVVRNGTL